MIGLFSKGNQLIGPKKDIERALYSIPCVFLDFANKTRGIANYWGPFYVGSDLNQADFYFMEFLGFFFAEASDFSPFFLLEKVL